MARERRPAAATEASETEADAATHGRRTGPRRRGLGLGWRLAFGTRDGRARGFLRFWPFYEKLYGPFHRTMAIPGAPRDMLRVRFIRFRGRPIDLPDGTHVARGDRVAELHFHNSTIMRAARSTFAGIVRGVTEDMRALAAWTGGPDFPADVRALYGVTILSRGTRRLGFTTRDQPLTIHTRLERFFMMGLLVIYSPGGVERLRRGSRNLGYPQEVWMSRGELVRRYGTPTAGEAASLRLGRERLPG